MTRSKHRAVSLRQLSFCALLLLFFSLGHINILICCLSFLTNKSFDRCMAHVKMARYESISDVAQMVPHKECCSNGVQCMVSGWPCQLRLTTPCPLVSRAHCTALQSGYSSTHVSHRPRPTRYTASDNLFDTPLRPRLICVSSSTDQMNDQHPLHGYDVSRLIDNFISPRICCFILVSKF